MALKKIKKWLDNDEEEVFSSSDEFYTIKTEEVNNLEGGNKMILLEPRAFSEAQTIADYLKGRDTVVVNLKRVTPEIAKRIVDFLSGAAYAIGGDLQKLGSGIFLCTPNNVNVEGKMSEGETKTPKKEKQKDEEFDW